MKLIGIASVLFSAFFSQFTYTQENEQPLTEEQQAYKEWALGIWDSLDKQTGDITLAGNTATLTVPESFYYLNHTDSVKVLSEVWGNPPEVSDGVLGMLFPADSTPFDEDAWGVTIEYQQEGYISDADADDIDYAELLEQMKDDTAQSSRARVEQGYESIALIGWASPPYYDTTAKKLHWAKEIQFGQNELHTLNYNIRVLGRKGVLVLNFIAGIDQLNDINGQLDSVLAMAEFNEGSRYIDFDPDIDEVAAYGLGALIAGKVVAKTGLLAAALIFLKKFGVFIVIGIGAFFKKLFGRKKAQDTA